MKRANPISSRRLAIGAAEAWALAERQLADHPSHAVGLNAPSHRVFVGRAEIGAAWPKRASEGRDYLSVKLDDPSFNAPIFANLFDGEDDTYNLIWSRGDAGIATKPRSHRRPVRIPPGGALLCFLHAPLSLTTAYN
jgi:uncharacterized protein (DUF736 family)